MSECILGDCRKAPLHGYLRYDIQPQVTNSSGKTNYRVFRLNGSNDVYLYEDRYTGAKVVGKFFRSSRKRDTEKAFAHLTREFDSLRRMREYGLEGYPHHFVRPLGCNSSLYALLITEYCEGELFQRIDPFRDQKRRQRTPIFQTACTRIFSVGIP